MLPKIGIRKFQVVTKIKFYPIKKLLKISGIFVNFYDTAKVGNIPDSLIFY